MSVSSLPVSRSENCQVSNNRILVVDDHVKSRESMADILQHTGFDVECCASAVEALALLERRQVDVIISDLKMPAMTGLEFLRTLDQRSCEAPVILVTAYATIASAVEAMRYGAFDYIEKPFDADRLESLVRRALQITTSGRPIRATPDAQLSVTMIGASPAMKTLRGRISQVAPTQETALITGESGTGKELVARSIHAASRRAANALVSLNCPALCAQLMESELFGHERGAFTSADAPRVGRFELADGGTIFLDEVTEIELPLQAKLLRVLQERSFERVGSSESRTVDVRVLASTNRDLQREVTEGRVREDLYYRLAVVPIHIPPLRERREDIDELVEYFVRQTAGRLERDPQSLDSTARQLLQEYDWPGNVRELENLMTRVGVLNDSATICADHLQPWLIQSAQSDSAHVAEESVPVGLSLEEMERKMIIATLNRFDGHRAKTALALGIGVRTLSGKLRTYGYAPRAKTLIAA